MRIPEWLEDRPTLLRAITGLLFIALLVVSAAVYPWLKTNWRSWLDNPIWWQAFASVVQCVAAVAVLYATFLLVKVTRDLALAGTPPDIEVTGVPDVPLTESSKFCIVNNGPQDALEVFVVFFGVYDIGSPRKKKVRVRSRDIDKLRCDYEVEIRLWRAVKLVLDKRAKFGDAVIEPVRLRVEVSYRESIRRGELYVREDYDILISPTNGDIRLKAISKPVPH